MMAPSVRRLYGPSSDRVGDLKKRIRARALEAGRAYVYRAGMTAEILISSEEVPGRSDLLVVYDSGVTSAMLRADLYGIEPDEVSYEELRRSVRA